MRARRAAALLFLALLAVGVGLYGPRFALGTHTFAAHDGFASDWFHFHWPLRTIAARAYRSFSLPLWTPLLGFGFPLHAEGQTALLYPINVLTLGCLPTAIAIHASVLLHHAIAGLGMFRLARRYRLHPGAAALGALVFAFGGFFVVHARHLNVVAVAAWLPWLVLALERVRRRPSVSTAAALTAVIAMILLGGHPQIAYGHALFAVLWLSATFALDARRAPGRRALPRLASALALGTAAGVLLAAPQLLPLLELHALGPRAGGLEATAAAAHDMWPRHLATFLDPYWFGDPSRGTYAGGEVLHWEIVANIGLPALLLAGVALVPRWSRRPLPVGRLLVLGALFAMLSLGQHGPLGSAARRLIPGFDLFRFPSRYLLHVAFVGALLAAAGADALIRRAARLRVALAVALPLIAYADLHRTLSHYNGLTEVAAWTRLPKTAAAILAQPTPTPTPPRVAALDLADATFAAAAARAGWSGDARAFALARETLRPNLPALYGLDGLFVYTHLYPVRVRASVEALLFSGADGVPRLSRRGANLFGVDWSVTLDEPAKGSEPVLEVRGTPSVFLARNPGAFPRAFMVGGARAVPLASSGAEIARVAALLTDPGLEVRDEAILEYGGPSEPRRHVEAQVQFVRYEAERVELQVDARDAGWLVFSDTHYPGWRAAVDGVDAEIVPADGFARAVHLGAGAHRVAFRFVSTSFRSGLALAVAGAGLLLLAAWIERRRGARPSA